MAWSWPIWTALTGGAPGAQLEDWWQKNQWWVYTVFALLIIVVVAYAYGKFRGF